MSNREVTAHSVWMRISLVSLIFVAAAAVPAAAQGRWKEVGKTSAGNSVFIDPKSMKTVNGIITAHVQVRFEKPVDAGHGKQWRLSRHIAMFDCAKKTVAAKESIYYSDYGATKVAEKTVIAKPGFGSPIGGSMTKVAWDYVCAPR